MSIAKVNLEIARLFQWFSENQVKGNTENVITKDKSSEVYIGESVITIVIMKNY